MTVERDLADARDLLARATRFDMGDGIEIWRGTDADWYVGGEVGGGSFNLTVDGELVPPGSTCKLEFGKPISGREVHPSRDAAVGALAAYRNLATEAPRSATNSSRHEGRHPGSCDRGCACEGPWV